MTEPSEQKSCVLTGVTARYYDFINFFFGVSLVNRRHLSSIRVKRGDQVLDVGCGTAEILKALYERHGNQVSLYGIDASSDMLSVATRKVPPAPSIRIEEGRATDLPFPDESFHWVVSCLTTHHLPLAEKRVMIAECRRVLKPNGRLVITDFGTPRHLLGEALGIVWRHHAYSHENIEGAILELLRENGFSVVDSDVQLGLIQHLTAVKPVPGKALST